MNLENLDELVEAILQRLEKQKPRALLLGEAPKDNDKYQYVKEKPYEAVVIGKLPPGQLLQMPSDPVCWALLEGKTVWLWPQKYDSPHARLLCRELAAAEQRLKAIGVRSVEEPGKLVTASAARTYLAAGEKPAPGSRLTPLARDILEGKAP